MTAILTPEAANWTTPPGWGIYADLTPPELQNARRLRQIRRLLALVLVGLVLIVAMGYGVARWESRQAAGEVAAEQARTAGLEAQVQQYSAVTVIQGSIAQVRQQVAQLMVADVDFGRLLGLVSAAQPRGLAVTQETVTVSGVAAAADASGVPSLDTSGDPVVGQITLAGSVGNLADVGTFVTALGRIPGATDITPTDTTLKGGTGTFSITLSVTDKILSHRYDAGSAAG